MFAVRLRSLPRFAPKARILIRSRLSSSSSCTSSEHFTFSGNTDTCHFGIVTDGSVLGNRLIQRRFSQRIVDVYMRLPDYRRTPGCVEWLLLPAKPLRDGDYGERRQTPTPPPVVTSTPAGIRAAPPPARRAYRIDPDGGRGDSAGRWRPAACRRCKVQR